MQAKQLTNILGAYQFLAGTAMATALAVASLTPASAAPINLGGYTGGIGIKFTDFESFNDKNGNPTTVLAPGDTNYGVFSVTSITDASGINNVWTNGGSNGYLVGIFSGITVQSITPAGTTFTTENSGGTFAIYQMATAPNFALGTSAFTQPGGLGCTSVNDPAGCYTGITGAPILTFNLVPGIDPNPTTTLQATISGTTIPVSGQAFGYGDVTGGSDAAQFGRGGFTTDFLPADLQIHDNFCSNPTVANGATSGTACGSVQYPGVGNWQDVSNDPVAAVAVVPEPASLALFGGGLLGLGLFFRRRQKRNSSLVA